MRQHCKLVIAMMFLCIATGVFADEPKAAGGAAPLKADSRARHTHRINLWDANGVIIEPKFDPKQDTNLQPYSPAVTCGKCHPTALIAHGWHFNAADPAVPAGRPGEPWLLFSKDAQTQIPVSSRGWKGTYKPQDIGVTSWKFVQLFGSHMPGGGVGNEYREADPKLIDPKETTAHWDASGKYEVDCLVCHSNTPMHDPSETNRQLGLENYKWAPTVAVGLARVDGSAKQEAGQAQTANPDTAVLDDADPANANKPAAAKGKGINLPMTYDRNRFDPNGRVFLDIIRTPPAERCYYCHTTREVGENALPAWQHDGDIHLRAGMKCTECHRNGIDHNIIRGYEDETPVTPESAPVSALTCRGCHLGDADAKVSTGPLGGRAGAPWPAHKGLPQLHLEKIACTACHSGNFPLQKPYNVQTSLAHKLGVETRDRHDDDWPHITAPVFVKLNGKLTPSKRVWPSFFGKLDKEGKVTPLPLEVVKPAVRQGAGKARDEKTGEMSNDQIGAVLAALKGDAGEGAEAVYIQRGQMFKANADGKLSAGEDNVAAKAYTWPIAHDVRPRSQALGARGCADCHDPNSPINTVSAVQAMEFNLARRGSGTFDLNDKSR